MIEGPMVSTHVTDYINFSHGTYQFIENTQDYCVWFLTHDDNKLHKKTIELLNSPKQRIHTTFYSCAEWLPINLELEANDCLLQLIQILKVNQMNWPGKTRQHILYDLYQWFYMLFNLNRFFKKWRWVVLWFTISCRSRQKNIIVLFSSFICEMLAKVNDSLGVVFAKDELGILWLFIWLWFDRAVQVSDFNEAFFPKNFPFTVIDIHF